jgi:hypothetical protein
MDSQELRSLQEAYLEVYQELDEELTGERKKRALEKGGYLANRVASGKEGQPVERRNRSGNVTMRTTTKAPTKRGGEEDKGERKTDWPGYEADRGSGNKAKRRAAELNKEEVDIYDIILSHLLDEGYAETPEAAKAIMVNMSEEWRKDIVEELTGPRKEIALAKGTPLARRIALGREGQPLERINRKTGEVTMRTTQKGPTKRGGAGLRGRIKSDWYGHDESRGGT